MEEVLSPTTAKSFKKYFPIGTTICFLICITLFIGINLEGKLDDLNVFRKWGAPSGIEIYNGDFWGLITSNFLHVELWHIGFNLYWLWIFGKKIEFETNKFFYTFLFLSSAIISSLAQLAFSESTGIGLSGIIYAFFGFLMVMGKTSEDYRNYIKNKTIYLFLFWLVLCVVLTRTGDMNVGNAAHIAGLLWGVILAYLSKYSWNVKWSAGFAFIAILVILIFYSPFSISYLSFQAHELHTHKKLDEAIEVYNKILQRDPDSEFAKVNLQQLELHKLQEKAFDSHTKQNYEEARQFYKQILLIDKNNQWAKENLKRLPAE